MRSWVGMIIPKEVRIGRETFPVLIRRTLGTRFGRIQWVPPAIFVRKRRPEQMSETFWHEVVHGILRDMGEDRLCGDERFVTNFAKRLNKVVGSAKL